MLLNLSDYRRSERRFLKTSALIFLFTVLTVFSGCFIDAPVSYPDIESNVTIETLEGTWEGPVSADAEGRYYRLEWVFTRDGEANKAYIRASYNAVFYADASASSVLYRVRNEFDLYLYNQYQAYLLYARESFLVGRSQMVTVYDPVIFQMYYAAHAGPVLPVLGVEAASPRQVTLSGYVQFAEAYPLLDLIKANNAPSCGKAYHAFSIRGSSFFEGDQLAKKTITGYPSLMNRQYQFTRKE